jgi:DNA processing protein
VAGCGGYPTKLADVWPDRGAPVWLAVRSPTGRLARGPAVAIVGTRHPTLDGLRTATELARLLARHRVTVVSGMARGIDQAAHRGALDAGGLTVAVLGAGFDVDYPRGDAALRDAIAASGGLVTELAPDARPAPRNFPARNRIISGLADLVVVVEGRSRSGAQQTARLAASQGRDVWAVPGSIHAPTSRAPLDLVRDGASVVTRLDDVLEAVAPAAPTLDRAADLDPDPDTDLDLDPDPDPDTDLDPDPDPEQDPGRGFPAGPAHRERHHAGLGREARSVLGLLSAAPAAPGALAGAAGLPITAVLTAVAELVASGLAASTPRGVVRRSP